MQQVTKWKRKTCTYACVTADLQVGKIDTWAAPNTRLAFSYSWKHRMNSVAGFFRAILSNSTSVDRALSTIVDVNLATVTIPSGRSYGWDRRRAIEWVKCYVDVLYLWKPKRFRRAPCWLIVPREIDFSPFLRYFTNFSIWLLTYR